VNHQWTQPRGHANRRSPVIMRSGSSTRLLRACVSAAQPHGARLTAWVTTTHDTRWKNFYDAARNLGDLSIKKCDGGSATR
jgi:hypothetical protein